MSKHMFRLRYPLFLSALILTLGVGAPILVHSRSIAPLSRLEKKVDKIPSEIIKDFNTLCTRPGIQAVSLTHIESSQYKPILSCGPALDQPDNTRLVTHCYTQDSKVICPFASAFIGTVAIEYKGDPDLTATERIRNQLSRQVFTSLPRS